MCRDGGCTITLKSHVLVLQPSLAVTCTWFVVPRANAVPDGGVDVIMMFVVQLSVAMMDQVTARLVLHVPTTLLVQNRVGGVVSTTVTRCVQVMLWFPQQSVALQIREAM